MSISVRAAMAAAVLAPNTRYAYERDWEAFRTWCKARDLSALPAETETVALYLIHRLQKGRVASALRYTSSISHAHKEAGYKTPCNETIWALLEGAQRLKQERPQPKAPFLLQHLRQLCETPPSGDALGLRNRALLVVGWASALRRSNLVALSLEDISFSPDGALVCVRREKQDQAGHGRVIGLPNGQHTTCPVRALRNWLEARGAWPGPVFCCISRGRLVRLPMTGNGVALVVKAAAGAIGLDPKSYGAHSLRSGFVTSAVEAGINEFRIAAQTGHRSLASLRRYFREDPFRANACASLGL